MNRENKIEKKNELKIISSNSIYHVGMKYC